MQGTSYLPGYFHVVDQNVGVNGSLWQLLSNGPACKISRFYNVLPEPSGPDSLLVFNKEILRQTMLKHEAIFRNQVSVIKTFQYELLLYPILLISYNIKHLSSIN